MSRTLVHCPKCGDQMLDMQTVCRACAENRKNAAQARRKSKEPPIAKCRLCGDPGELYSLWRALEGGRAEVIYYYVQCRPTWPCDVKQGNTPEEAIAKWNAAQGRSK